MTCGRCGQRIDFERTFCPCGAANLPALASVSISPAATPTRTRQLPKVRHEPKNSWERGIPVSHRVDGSVMPYLDSNLNPHGIKDWGQKYRRKFEEAGLA